MQDVGIQYTYIHPYISRFGKSESFFAEGTQIDTELTYITHVGKKEKLFSFLVFYFYSVILYIGIYHSFNICMYSVQNSGNILAIGADKMIYIHTFYPQFFHDQRVVYTHRDFRNHTHFLVYLIYDNDTIYIHTFTRKVQQYNFVY